jgi:hypothetical protein
VRNYNPVWTPDGESIYFISDRTGIANIYRVDLSTGVVAQVSDIFQGISGISQLSPALAGARDADRLVFSVFERNGYNLYRLDDATRLEGVQVVTAETTVNGMIVPVPAILPPTPRPVEAPYTRILTYLEDAATGLPTAQAATAWAIDRYRPRLSLDYLGQPQIGFSTGGVFGGGGLYGGIAGVFSDMLAWHTLFGVIQAQGELDQVGFSLAYLYRRHRWDFGVAAQRIPFITGGRRAVIEDGLYRDQIIIRREFDWQLQGLAQLPISRVQRLEFSAGPRRIAGDIRVEELVGVPVFGPGGQVIALEDPEILQQRQSLGALNFFEANAALVFDNALFGWTSPLAGQRYRLQVSPTVGSLNFVSLLGDYRRYLWFQPFTLAGRGLHFGRYGIGEDERLGQIYLGQPQLMRGYDYNRLRQDCRDQQATPETTGACEVFNQQFGSHVAVTNLELRFPLIGALVLGTGMGFPPIEGFAFFDAGVAWGIGTSPAFATGIQADEGDRGILSSYGVGARINLFGYAVVEIDYVNPVVGDRGWHWQFALQPGF